MSFRNGGNWAVAICMLLAACGTASSAASSPAPVTTATPAPSTSLPTAAPTATPFPSLLPASAPTTLADSPWWRVGFGATPGGTLIEVGVGNGTITGQLQISDPHGEGLGPPFARGPFHGRVVAGSAPRGRDAPTDLTIIDVPTGLMAVVVSEPDILDATLDPTGTVLYWVTAGGDQDGVSRLSLVDGRRERLLAFPSNAAAGGGIVPAAYIELTAQVAMSADGSRLAAMRCRQDGCDLGVMDLAAAEVAWYRVGEPWQSLLGFAANGISLVSQCVSDSTGDLIEHCGVLDARAAAAELSRNLAGDAELPAGWHLEIRRVPNAPPMSFQVEVVAVPDEGGEAVPFLALEAMGQG